MPIHSVTDARSDIYILEEREIRQSNLEIVSHSVLELVRKSRLPEFLCLEVYLVLERRAITYREFFVKLFLSDTILFLERIYPAHGKRDVRERERIVTERVARILAVEGVHREVELSVPVLGKRYGR